MLVKGAPSCYQELIIGHPNYMLHFIWITPRFQIVYFLMGPWDPRAMILMSPRALEMAPIIDVFIHWKI